MSIHQVCTTAKPARAGQSSMSTRKGSLPLATVVRMHTRVAGIHPTAFRSLRIAAHAERNESQTRGHHAAHSAAASSRRSLLLGAGVILTGVLSEPLQALAGDASSKPSESPSPPSAAQPSSTDKTGGAAEAASTLPEQPVKAEAPPKPASADASGSEAAGKKKTNEELEVEAQRIIEEEEQAKKKKRRNKFQELAEVRDELRQKQVKILEREAELLDAEQTVAVLREELQLERSLRDLLTKEKEKAEEQAKLALGFCGQGYLLP